MMSTKIGVYMKKTILSLTTAALLSSSALFANEVTEAEHEGHGSKFYVIAKALVVLGEEKNGVEGDTGYGAGLDIGYKLPYHLSVELISSYAHNKIGEFDASYLTYGGALEYTYHVAKHAGLFVKAGLEIEDAEIENESESESGFIYAMGAEYEVASHYDVVVEYEGSTIESTRGPSVFAGVKYNF